MSKATEIDGVNFGPLAALVGRWEGGKGMDVAPEPDGEEKNPYYESILFEVIGDVTNAESQTLAVLRYHQVVKRQSDNQVFHNETGYWSWDAATGVVMQSLTIPRGLCLLAGGNINDVQSLDEELVFQVQAKADDPQWGIVQSPFMQENAKTQAFTHEIKVHGDKLEYSETTVVDIYGRIFDHTDANSLTRCD